MTNKLCQQYLGQYRCAQQAVAYYRAANRTKRFICARCIESRRQKKILPPDLVMLEEVA